MHSRHKSHQKCLINLLNEPSNINREQYLRFMRNKKTSSQILAHCGVLKGRHDSFHSGTKCTSLLTQSVKLCYFPYNNGVSMFWYSGSQQQQRFFNYYGYWLPQLFVFVRSLYQLAKLQNLPPSQPQVFVMRNDSSNSAENERQEIVDCTHSYYTQFYLLKFVNQQNSQLSSAPLVCLGYQLLKFF